MSFLQIYFKFIKNSILSSYNFYDIFMNLIKRHLNLKKSIAISIGKSIGNKHRYNSMNNNKKRTFKINIYNICILIFIQTIVIEQNL